VLAIKQLFPQKMVEVLACAFFRDVLFCGRDFFVVVRGEKKQNKIPSNCTALSTEHQSSPSVF
jgi:hypothetical protein